jgi:hypothetical protein
VLLSPLILASQSTNVNVFFTDNGKLMSRRVSFIYFSSAVGVQLVFASSTFVLFAHFYLSAVNKYFNFFVLPKCMYMDVLRFKLLPKCICCKLAAEVQF